MTLLTTVQKVCAVVGVTVPTSVFSGIATNRTLIEMLECANEMAQRTAYDNRDWTIFRKKATFVGDGVTEAFNMPGDYKRMLLSANVWRSTSTYQPMTQITDSDDWLHRRNMGWFDAWGEWTMMGGQMHIWPIMPVGVTASFMYVEKNCIMAGSVPGNEFTQDTDTYRLDERLLKLGMIYNWKQLHGSPYAEDMGTWSDAAAMLFAKDVPAAILVDHSPISSMARVSVPNYTIYAPRTPAFP